MSRPPRRHIGIAVPQSFCGDDDYGQRLRRFASTAEAAGFDSIWVQEQLLGDDPSVEPLTALSFTAAATERMLLGTATVVAPLREATLFAKQVTSLDRMSGGRLILTLSIGGDDPRIFNAVGVPVEDRLPRMLDLVERSRDYWKQRTPGSDGSSQVAMSPTPYQSPHPPIWFGGEAEVAVRRAARIGSGWIGAGGSSPDAFERGVEIIEQELRRAGRLRSQFVVAKKVYLHVHPDPDHARRRLLAWFRLHWPEHMEPDKLFERVAIWGDGEMAAAAVKGLYDAGADLVVLNPVSDEEEQLPLLSQIIGAIKNRPARHRFARSQPFQGWTP